MELEGDGDGFRSEKMEDEREDDTRDSVQNLSEENKRKKKRREKRVLISEFEEHCRF